ncbi:MAG: hypothetical protein SGILL_007800 [Bacillariaceae sp.]
MKIFLSSFFAAIFAATIVSDVAASGKKGGRSDDIACGGFIGYYEGLDPLDGGQFLASVFPSTSAPGKLQFQIRDDVVTICGGILAAGSGIATCKGDTLEASINLVCPDDAPQNPGLQTPLDFVLSKTSRKQFLVDVNSGETDVTAAVVWKMV